MIGDENASALKALSLWKYPFSGDQIDPDSEGLTDYGRVSDVFWCLFERKKIFLNRRGEVIQLKLKKLRPRGRVS